jgi:pimeloyl-ACP methyl ester carboxylesterase
MGDDPWIGRESSRAAHCSRWAGESQWPLANEYAPWEESYIVVQWDQRGAGRTFGRSREATPDVNLDRIASDGSELADYLCKELGKSKVIALGHSWGSIVAVRRISSNLAR